MSSLRPAIFALLMMPLLVAVGLAHSLKEFEEQLSTQEEYLQPIDKPTPDFRLQDAEGHVVYSDRGTTKGAPKTAVHVDEPDPAEVARLAKQQEVLKATELAREHQAADDDRKKATEEHRKAATCQSARNYYFHLRDLNRIYHDDAAGNRHWYSDPEADALKEHARQAMTAACGA